MAKQAIEVITKFDLKKIKLDLAKEINLAAGLIIKDIAEKNQKGLDINGSTIKPLKPNTIASKANKGSSDPSRALHDTGRMIGRGSVKGTGGRGPYISKRATKTNQESRVSIAKDRELIGVYHNEGIGVPQREWFGISKDAEKNIVRMVELKIERMVRNA